MHHSTTKHISKKKKKVLKNIAGNTASKCTITIKIQFYPKTNGEAISAAH